MARKAEFEKAVEKEKEEKQRQQGDGNLTSV